jgi:hypothetical protein
MLWNNIEENHSEQEDQLALEMRADFLVLDNHQHTISDLVEKKDRVFISEDDISEAGLVWVCEKHSHSEVIKFCERTDTQLQDGVIDVAQIQEELKNVIVTCIDKNIQANKGKCADALKNINEKDELWDITFLSQMSFNLFDSVATASRPIQVGINEIDLKQLS